jgi:hypothetical protein
MRARSRNMKTKERVIFSDPENWSAGMIQHKICPRIESKKAVFLPFKRIILNSLPVFQLSGKFVIKVPDKTGFWERGQYKISLNCPQISI